MSRLRPTGSGRDATVATFRRRTTSPIAALVIGATPDPDRPLPSDWPTQTGAGASDSQLGHAVGWVCEVRADHLVLLNPLGEGVFRTALPSLDDGWVDEVRASASAAVYLLDRPLPGGAPDAAVDAAAADGPILAASVRTAISDDYGVPKAVGRNDPCWCGSGRKYKHCHLK
jgi:hypothetical protein